MASRLPPPKRHPRRAAAKAQQRSRRTPAWPLPLYSHGGVSLYHGDCLDLVPRLIAERLIVPAQTVIITDPPYDLMTGGGDNFKYARRFYNDPRLVRMATFDFGGHIPRLLDACAAGVFFHSRAQIAAYAHALASAGMSYDLHVWHKPGAIPFTANTWRPDLEYIAVGRRKGVRLTNAPLVNCSKVWTGAPPYFRLHPAQKPIGVLTRYLRLPGLILDPFAGSGTTLLLALSAGRQALGIERDLAYCQMAIRRLKEAVRLRAEPARP